jgi:hypothetical protein
MSAETVVVRLLCEGGQLRPVGHRAVQASDLPEVKGRVLRFDVEGGTEAEIAAASLALEELVRVARERGAARVETVWEEPPVVRASRALEAGVVERDGATSVEALVQVFAERIGRLQSQAGADRLAADLQRTGERCSAVALAIHVIAWCASRSHRAALFGFLASVRAAELSSRERREGLQ